MSRVSFESTYENSPVLVTGGWDHPTEEFFLHVERTEPKDGEDDFVWVSLEDYDDDDSYGTERLRAKLTELGVEPPPRFWEIVEGRARNHVYDYKNNEWARY